MANEGAGSVEIEIGGQRYNRILGLNLKISMLEATCSGTIVLSWPGAEHMTATGGAAPAFSAGAKGTIYLDGQMAAEIQLDKRLSKGSPKSYELTLQFRGTQANDVDNSTQHQTGQENKQKAVPMLKKFMQGSSTQLVDRTKDGGPMVERFIVATGEPIERIARRLLRDVGLSIIPTRDGKWEVWDKDTQPPQGHELRIGRNFTHWSTKQDIVPMFEDTTILTHKVETDDTYGKSASFFADLQLQMGQLGAAQKSGDMRRITALIDGDHSKDTTNTTGQFNVGRRSAQGLNVTLRVSTWSDNNGELWQHTKVHHIVIPVDEIDEDCQLVEVEYELAPESRSATLVFIGLGAISGSPGGGRLNPDQEIKACSDFDPTCNPNANQPPQQPNMPPPPS